jgi:hypothetical protein
MDANVIYGAVTTDRLISDLDGYELCPADRHREEVVWCLARATLAYRLAQVEGAMADLTWDDWDGLVAAAVEGTRAILPAFPGVAPNFVDAKTCGQSLLERLFGKLDNLPEVDEEGRPPEAFRARIRRLNEERAAEHARRAAEERKQREDRP